MHVLSIYIYIYIFRLFVHSFVRSCVCLVHKEAMKIPQPLPKPIKGVCELTGLLVIDWETSPIPQKQCMCTEELFGGLY